MKRNKCVDALLYCLGSRKDHRIESSLEAFSEQDWIKFIEISQVHRVAPILFRRLKSQGRGKSVPSWVIKRLGGLYLLSVKKKSTVVDELIKIFTKLKGDGVSFIVLKGPHLAEFIYEDWALRPMGDLDILVKEEEVSSVCSSLENMGYYKEIKDLPANHHHLPPFVKKGSLPIEIHLDIGPTEILPFKADHEMLWQRAQSIKIGGVEVFALALEDLLLHLSLHVCQHNFKIDLMHIFDIYEILRKYKEQVNWEEIVSRANLWNAMKLLYLTLEVVRELLGISAPEETLDNLRPQDYSVELLKGAEVRVLGLEGPVSPKFIDVTETRGLWAKLKLICKIALSREVVSSKYPLEKNPRLIGYYYVLHLSDLTARYVKLAPKVIRSGKKELIKPEQMARSMQKWLSTV